jgi:DNA-binding transcriptional LysR family regulator
VKVQVRRSLSSKIPNELLDGNLELGVISYDPGDERLKSKVIYTDALAFVVSPRHRLASRKTVSITELARRTSSRTTWCRRTARWCCASFRAHKVPLRMDVEMPTIETIRKLVQRNRAWLSAAHVRGTGDRAEAAVRGAGEGDARGAEDPADLSHAPGAEPRGEGVSGRVKRFRFRYDIEDRTVLLKACSLRRENTY